MTSQKTSQNYTTHLKKTFTYTSPDIQIKIIVLISQNICAALQSSVQSNRVWALIADETSDISHQEQFPLCFRTVMELLQIKEHFYKFVAVSDANTIFKSIKKNMFDAGFPVHSLYFQCHNGALLQTRKDNILK